VNEERQVKAMENLKSRLTFLEKEVADLKAQFEGQPIKLQRCDCGRSIHHEDVKFCGNCGSSLTYQKSITIEGRLMIHEDSLCIATKEGIYFVNGTIADLSNEIGLDSSKFVRLLFKEIDEKSNRSGLFEKII